MFVDLSEYNVNYQASLWIYLNTESILKRRFKELLLCLQIHCTCVSKYRSTLMFVGLS